MIYFKIQIFIKKIIKNFILLKIRKVILNTFFMSLTAFMFCVSVVIRDKIRDVAG